jgi:hypothetical protein
MTATLAGMMVFLLVAEIFLVPASPLLAARRTPKPLHAAGWITVGGLDADAPTVRSLAQAVPPPIDPVELDQVILLTRAASGSASSRLTVDVYELAAGKGATGHGRLVSSETRSIGGPDPGLIHLMFDPPVHARPGHWYTFVLSTSEPGSGVLLGMTTGGIDTPALWTLDDRAGAKPVLGNASWAPVLGFKLLMAMQY